MSSSDVRSAIVEANKKQNEEANQIPNGGGEVFASYFTEDGVINPPDGERYEGREAIEDFFVRAFEDEISNLETWTDVVEDSGDVARELGHYEITDFGGDVSSGQYLAVWKKVGGEWRMYWDIWTEQ